MAFFSAPASVPGLISAPAFNGPVFGTATSAFVSSDIDFIDNELNKLQIPLPEESTIVENPASKKSRCTSLAMDLPKTFTIINLPNDVLEELLKYLPPQDLKIIARTCTTLYVSCKNAKVLQASVCQILPNVRLLSNCMFTSDQQFRILCSRFFGETKLLKQLKLTRMDKVLELSGTNGFNGSIDAIWKCFKTLCDLRNCPADINQLYGLSDNRMIVEMYSLYDNNKRTLINLVGSNFNGDKSTIDPNSEVGKIVAKLASVFAKYDDQQKCETLIRSLEQNNNN